MSKLRNQVSLFMDHKGQWGLRRALYWSLMNLAQRTLGLHLHYVSYQSGMRAVLRPKAPKTPDGYQTRLIAPAELMTYADAVPELNVDVVQTANLRGDECVANFYHDELVGWTFNARSRTAVTDQLDALVPNGFRCTYYTWTHPDHRQKRLGGLRIHVLRQARIGRALERSIGWVETHNYPSLLRSYRSPPERRINMGYVGWINLFGREIPFNSRRAKWIGFEFVRKERNRVRQYTEL